MPGLFCVLGSRCCFETVHFTKEKTEGDSEVPPVEEHVGARGTARVRVQTAAAPRAYIHTVETGRSQKQEEARSSGLRPARVGHTAAIKPRHSGPEWLPLLNAFPGSRQPGSFPSSLAPAWGRQKSPPPILWLFSIPMGRLSESWPSPLRTACVEELGSLRMPVPLQSCSPSSSLSSACYVSPFGSDVRQSK